MKLTKKDRLEAYEKIFGDDEDYINSFLKTDKYPIHIYNEKDGNKPFFEGYRPNYYFKTNEEKVDNNILSKIINESVNQIPEYTSASSKGFTLEDMYKAMEQLEKLPPVPIEIEIGKIAWLILNNQLNIHMIHDSSKINTLFGINIVFYEGDEIKFNQMRVKYSNGDSKIIDVFEYNCDYDYIYKNIIMEG
jgi:hypothetical protein